ncbi:MAG: AraC family transcriptional regulator ligand-binding domain-containing protein [Rubrivivax sp.]
MATPSVEAARAVALREKRYPPMRIAAAVEAAVECGLDAGALLAGTGLTEGALADPDQRVSSLQLLSVLRNAVRLGAPGDIGLRTGARLHASCYGMLGYAMLCSPTMRKAFDTGLRFYRLGSSMQDAEWFEAAGNAVWRIPAEDRLGLPDASPALARVVVELTLAALFTIFRDVMGPWCLPLRVRFTGPPPAHADALARTFGCPLEFGQAGNELHYPADWLERAPQLANPIAAAQASNTCARMLEELKWQSGITRRVYHELTCTPGRFPEIEAVASTLCMTSRTLRRKLEAEGTSYSQLLDDVRRSLAQDYLRTSMLGTDDIAAALGFADAASFRRAYKRWTGRSPGLARSA